MISSISPDWSSEKTARGKTLCAAFLNAPKHQRFLLGRNVYAKAVADHISVAGVIDDFTKETIWAGLPIVKLTDVPDEAIVLACSGGRPLTVRRLLNQKGVTHLDYFTFLKFSGLTLPQAVFNEDFAEIATNHQAALEWLDHLMADKISRTTLRQLISFRMSYDLAALEGFTQREDVQYFEPFIDFAAGTPVFVDVGGYDGFTAKEFIRQQQINRCARPRYNSLIIYFCTPMAQGHMTRSCGFRPTGQPRRFLRMEQRKFRSAGSTILCMMRQSLSKWTSRAPNWPRLRVRRV